MGAPANSQQLKANSHPTTLQPNAHASVYIADEVNNSRDYENNLLPIGSRVSWGWL